MTCLHHHTNKSRKQSVDSKLPAPLVLLTKLSVIRDALIFGHITKLFLIILQSRETPTDWKKTCTVLIHKKGERTNPANFRPITLESIPLKIFSSCLRDSLFSFLTDNSYIEHKIQSNFLPKLSGTFEHNAQMANSINNARIKQRSVVITLLDLKNAFGEVHHNLISEVLMYYHVPSHRSLCSNFQTSIITDSFQTPFISVCRGVLQRDCLSQLTFNLSTFQPFNLGFNAFIRYISDQKFNQFGFTIGSLSPAHWFQFADDAAVITSYENESQIMLNHFTRWRTWATWSSELINVPLSE